MYTENLTALVLTNSKAIRHKKGHCAHQESIIMESNFSLLWLTRFFYLFHQCTSNHICTIAKIKLQYRTWIFKKAYLFKIIKEFLILRITSLFCNACFPLLLLQRKEKKHLFVINTLFFVLISTHKTERKSWDYIPTYFFQSNTTGLPPMSNLRAAFIQHM